MANPIVFVVNYVFESNNPRTTVQSAIHVIGIYV